MNIDFAPSVSSIQVKTLPIKRNYKTTIAFGSNQDGFVRQNVINQYESSITEIEIRQILDEINKRKKCDNEGCASSFYKVGNYGIKIHKSYSEMKENFGNDSYYANEALALKKLEEAGVEDVPKVAARFENGNKRYLITSFIQWKSPNIQTNPLTVPQMEDLLENKLSKMDQSGIVNFDLHMANILTQENKAKIIDFGAFDILGNDGMYIRIEHASKDNNKISNDILEKLSSNQKTKILNTFNMQLNDLTRSDNPNLNIISNVTTFECRGINQILTEMSSDKKYDANKSVEFFKSYLKARSKYHEKMADFLKSITPKSDIEDTHLKAIEYEEFCAKTLKDPTDNIIKMELTKLKFKSLIIKYLLEGQKSPLPSLDEFNRLMKEHQINSSAEDKKFAEYILENFKNFDWVDKHIPKDDVNYNCISKETESFFKAIQVPKIESKNKKLLPAVLLISSLTIGIIGFTQRKNFLKTNN